MHVFYIAVYRISCPKTEKRCLQHKLIINVWTIKWHTFLAIPLWYWTLPTHTPTWPGRVLCQVPPIMLCSCVVKWVKRMAILHSHPPSQPQNFHPPARSIPSHPVLPFPPLWRCTNPYWGSPPTFKFPPSFSHFPIHLQLNSLYIFLSSVRFCLCLTQ